MEARGAGVGTCTTGQLEGHLPGSSNAEEGEDSSHPGPSLQGPSGCSAPALPATAGGREGKILLEPGIPTTTHK